MKSLREYVKILSKNVMFIILGVVLWVVILTYLILSVPIFIYRWITKDFIVPIFRSKIGKAVTVSGQVMAAEFLNPDRAPRCNLAVNLIIDGQMSYEAICELIEQKWIKATTEQGTLKYPELQQYLIHFMGFMFWKQDKKFDLKNHIQYHKIEGDSDQDSEQFLCQLMEQEVNSCYTEKRSPWKLHYVHNYRNSTLYEETRGSLNPNDMSLLVLRIHHGLADGFAIMHLIMEQLCGHPIEKSKVATPAKNNDGQFLKKITSLVTYPLNFLHESGNIIMMGFSPKTPFHCDDSKKSWKQLYARSPLIPMSKIKFVKNVFGVSFAAVVNSCVSASISNILEELMSGNKKYGKIPKNILMGIPIPTSFHPKKLRNNALGVAFFVPTKKNLNAVHRLRQCERNMQRAKNSPMPLLASIGVKTFPANLTRISRSMAKNRYLGTGISSFPGPGIEMDLNGKRVLAVDFAGGPLEGVTGLAFMALSYVDSFRICATAESAVLSQDQINKVIDLICKELDVLYDLALNESNGSPKSVTIDMV